MANTKFSHDGKNYTIKGEWDKNTFTAQAFAGKTAASHVFSVEKPTKKGTQVADDKSLEEIVIDSVKQDVESGEYQADDG